MRFRFRLMVTLCLLVALSFGIGGGILISASFRASVQVETENALNTYASVRNTIYLLNSVGNQDSYEDITQGIDKMQGTWTVLRLRIEQAQGGGEVIYQSGPDDALPEELPVPMEDKCVYVQVSDAFGKGLQVRSIIAADSSILTLDARFDLSSVYDARQTQLKLYLLIYAAVVVLSILVALALSTLLTKHLDKLTRTARRIAGGDLSTRSGIRTADEFGQLSRDFDTMADRLQETIGRLESDMQRQEAFMGAFAHELKTPMTAIIGYADLLRQDGLDATTRLIAANYIYSEGQRLENLSFKLLNLLLLQKDDFAMWPVNLQSFLQEVEKALEPVMKAKNIRFVCRGDRGRVLLEPDLARSLLYNLADNAAKAMEGDGIIAIKGTLIPGGCQIQVVDNGRGMAQEELSKITEAFYRVDKSRSRKQGGAGLGLALCRQIVALHRGNIQFQSAVGTGTRVTVTLYGGDDHD